MTIKFQDKDWTYAEAGRHRGSHTNSAKDPLLLLETFEHAGLDYYAWPVNYALKTFWPDHTQLETDFRFAFQQGTQEALNEYRLERTIALAREIKALRPIYLEYNFETRIKAALKRLRKKWKEKPPLLVVRASSKRPRLSAPDV